MPLIQTKCPNCGGTVKINPENKTGYCPNCDSEFLIDENIINISNQYNIQNSTVIINNQSSPLDYINHIKEVSDNFTLYVIDGFTKEDYGNLYSDNLDDVSLDDYEKDIYHSIQCCEKLSLSKQEDILLQKAKEYLYMAHAFLSLKKSMANHYKKVALVNKEKHSLELNRRATLAKKTITAWFLGALMVGFLLLTGVNCILLLNQYVSNFIVGFTIGFGCITFICLVAFIVILILRHNISKKFILKIDELDEPIKQHRNDFADFLNKNHINEGLLPFMVNLEE